jgi:hypothetical protein
MTQWISAQAAFAHVVSCVMAPDIAEDDLLAAARARKLPARARILQVDQSYTSLTALLMPFWEAQDVHIDYQDGTGVSTNVTTFPGGGFWSEVVLVSEIEFSRKHLFQEWPESDKRDKPHRPAGTSMQRADEPFLVQMEAAIEAQGITPSAAAWKIIGKDGRGVPGVAEPESKVRRLVARFKERNGE